MPTPASIMEKPVAVMQAGKISIIMFSGTADKFIPLGVISQAAAAMEMQVTIFVTGFALAGVHQETPRFAVSTGSSPRWRRRCRRE